MMYWYTGAFRSYARYHFLNYFLSYLQFALPILSMYESVLMLMQVGKPHAIRWHATSMFCFGSTQVLHENLDTLEEMSARTFAAKFFNRTFQLPARSVKVSSQGMRVCDILFKQFRAGRHDFEVSQIGGVTLLLALKNVCATYCTAASILKFLQLPFRTITLFPWPLVWSSRSYFSEKPVYLFCNWIFEYWSGILPFNKIWSLRPVRSMSERFLLLLPHMVRGSFHIRDQSSHQNSGNTLTKWPHTFLMKPQKTSRSKFNLHCRSKLPDIRFKQQ